MKDNLTLKEAQEALSKRRISVHELCKFYSERIKEKNGDISAFLEVFEDLEKQAKEAQKSIDEGEASSLTGIPLAIKDNILIKDRKVSAASAMLEDFVAPYDSTVAGKLKKEKTVFLGRTNMDEFAMGASTEKSAFIITKNPNDTSRVPGGSSGGSAAAVSSGMAPAALGSDTGGSVRQPASFCGCVGLKPTYGAVSRFGLIAMGSSLDQIGPLTQTVTDSEILFESIAGRDPFDGTTYEREAFKEEKKPKDTVVGVPWHLIRQDGVDKEVLEVFKKNISELEKLGYKTKEVKLPQLEYTLSAYYVLVQAEISSNMARFDGMRYGAKVEGKDLLEEYMKTRALFGKEVKRRIMVGTYVLSAGYYDTYYNKAYTVRKLAISDFERVFSKDKVDVVAFPTSPTPAFKVGEKNEDPVQMYMADVFTVPANIAGVPAISIPSGTVVKEGKELPSGLQFMAPWKREDVLFSVGKHFKKEV